MRVRRPGRARAHREPRRAHPRGLPRHGPELARRQPGLPAAGRQRRRADPPAGARPPRGPGGTVRAGRAGEVPDRRGARGAGRDRTGQAARGVMTYKGRFRVWRGDDEGGALADYDVEVNEGEVVLDVVHRLQATQAPDLAVRWNCKAGKCGSCSAEVNGRPRLLCMTRMSIFEPGEPVTVTPLRAFPVVRDLVTDVSYNYAKARAVPSFAPPDLAPGEYRMQQIDVERSQEFRKCIECFLCQNTCHVVRDHEENKPAFAGPRFFA